MTIPGILPTVAVGGGIRPGSVTPGGIGGSQGGGSTALSGKYNVLDYNIRATTSSGNAALMNALAALIPAAGGTVYWPAGSYRVDNDVEWPANVTHEFSTGAMLSIDATRTVTIHGSVVAVASQIFSGLGLASLTRTSVVYPQWWGARGDGTADDGVKIQAAIDALSAGGIVHVPPGVYIFTRTVYLKSNITIEGEGWLSELRASSVGWAYPTYTMLELEGHTSGIQQENVVVQDLAITARWGGVSPTEAGYCVAMTYVRNCVIRRVRATGADRSCLMISGYAPDISNYVPTFDNPFFGFAPDNLIEDCWVDGGYHGIELFGGAQASLLRNTVASAVYHGIRMTGGGWDSVVACNEVRDCSQAALYVDCVQRTRIEQNVLTSNRAAVQLGISFGLVLDVVVTRNVVRRGAITDEVLYDTGRFPTNLIVANNIVLDGGGYGLLLGHSVRALVTGNVVLTDALVLRGTTTGLGVDNIVVDVTVADAATLVQNGGAIALRGNRVTDTMQLLRPEYQLDGPAAGAWVPTLRGSGTAGDYTLTVNDGSARYQRVGDQVTVQASVTVTVSSAGAGLAKFGGLPFSKAANRTLAGAVATSGVDFPAGTVGVAVLPWTSGASSDFSVASVADDGALVTLDVAALSTGDVLVFSFTYFVS